MGSRYQYKNRNNRCDCIQEMRLYTQHVGRHDHYRNVDQHGTVGQLIKN